MTLKVGDGDRIRELLHRCNKSLFFTLKLLVESEISHGAATAQVVSAIVVDRSTLIGEPTNPPAPINNAKLSFQKIIRHFLVGLRNQLDVFRMSDPVQKVDIHLELEGIVACDLLANGRGVEKVTLG